jgi:hydroxymethylbilane synthase
MPQPTTTLKLGTRGSVLARVQSQHVADLLEKHHPGLAVELEIFKTSGDQIADRPLHEAGGKGLFTRELEQALLDRQIDFAVHSFKDLPVTMPLVDQTDLIIAATTQREDARDVLVLPHPITPSPSDPIDSLSQNALVGTGSLRRRCQLLSVRPDLRVQNIRGNIDTRLRKVTSGEYAGVILAMAGLKRAGLFDSSTMHALPEETLLPAAGQGALAIQCRRSDDATHQLLSAVNHAATAVCVKVEREIVRRLDGDCFSPIAAYATTDGTALRLRCAIGRRGGEPPLLHCDHSAPESEADRLLESALKSLSDQGVMSHLHGS